MTEERICLLLRGLGKDFNLTAFVDRVIGSVGEEIPSMAPVIKHLVDLFVIHELFHENIYLQSLKLWLPQKGMGILLAVVVCEEFPRKVIITGTNLSAVGVVVV